jgi:hypothetical protein
MVLVLTAAVAFSACESPSDVTDKQNVIPVGGLPVKSVSVEMEKAVKNEVNNSFKAVDISVSFTPGSSFIDLNSKTPYLTLQLEADIPLPPSQNGVFVNKFSLNVNNVIADGRPYMIESGNNQSASTAAVFNTVTFYNDQGQLRSLPQLLPLTANDSAVIRFTHDPVNKAIIGDLTAYKAKDTVIRIPMDIDTAEAEAIFKQYEDQGIEIKNPVYFTIEGNDVVFDAIQILLNVHSTITAKY